MKKYSLYLIALLCLSIPRAYSQNDPYAEECNRLYKAYLTHPEDVANMLDMTAFYCNRDNSMFNLGQAFKYIRQAEQVYVSILCDRDHYKEMRRLLKRQITLDSIRSFRQRIERDARMYVLHAPTLTQSELESLSSAFRGVPAVIKVVEQRRLGERYAESQKSHTLLSYRQFAEKYKGSEQSIEATRAMVQLADSLLMMASSVEEVDELVEGCESVESIMRLALQRKATLEYADVLATHTEEAYRQFLSRYPASNEYTHALEQLDGLLAADYAALRTPRQMADFAHQHSSSPLADSALAQLRHLVGDLYDPVAARIYFAEFPLDKEYGNLYRRHYSRIAEEGNGAPIQGFRQRHPGFPYMGAVEADLVKARMVDSVDFLSPYNEAKFLDWATVVRRLAGKRISLIALTRCMQPFIAARDWKGADKRAHYFYVSFAEDYAEEYQELRRLVSAPTNSRLSCTPEVTPTYQMRGAAVHPNGRQLYYTQQQGNQRAIHMAQLQQGSGAKWKGMGPVRFDNIENRGLTFYNLFDNGRKMLLGQNGDILIAEYQDSLWHVTEIPSYPVNTDYEDYDAFMLPDGSGILLASDRPDGHNYQPSGAPFHGDTALASDIYFVPRSLHGWGEAINLGPSVNTPYCDHAPLLSSDLKTLYFVSDGHVGLGHGDLFYCTRKDINDWTSWSKPVNYGKEVNGAADEGHLSFSADERSLYLCSNRNGRYGLYRVPTIHTPINKVVEVTLSSAAATQVDIIDLSTQSIVSQVALPQDNEPVKVRLYTGKRYAVQPQIQGYSLIPAEVFTATSGLRLNLRSFEKAPAVAQKLEAVRFESGTALLTPLAQREMDHLADFLLEHPDVSRIYLSVNVSGADDQQCFLLSRSRALALKRHLERRGVHPDRVLITAYGNVNGSKVPEVELLW